MDSYTPIIANNEEHRWFEGEWGCTICGQPFDVRIGCLWNEEDGTPYPSIAIALEDHECNDVTIARGAEWTPLREDIPEIPTWDEMSPWE